MSGASPEPEEVHNAVPIPDLGFLDEALRAGPAAIKHAVKRVRPADLGRDLSRRTVAEARALLDAIDDRRGAAMLRAAHPAVAAQLLAELDCRRAVHLLSFVPTDHEVAILAHLPPAARANIEQAYGPAEKADVDRLLAYPEARSGA